eukprot:351955-Chlamydomonas_euryale.AAC.24
MHQPLQPTNDAQQPVASLLRQTPAPRALRSAHAGAPFHSTKRKASDLCQPHSCGGVSERTTQPASASAAPGST